LRLKLEISFFRWRQRVDQLDKRGWGHIGLSLKK
jgi:hypothetical protein